MRPAADLAPRVSSRGELCGTRLLYFHRCFRHSYDSSLLRKWSAHERQKLAGLFVGFCSGDKADVHASDLVDFIVFDLREDQLLAQAHVVVAAAVEAVRVDAAEVADTRELFHRYQIRSLLSGTTIIKTHYCRKFCIDAPIQRVICLLYTSRCV